jgi:hypothetical protein
MLTFKIFHILSMKIITIVVVLLVLTAITVNSTKDEIDLFTSKDEPLTPNPQYYHSHQQSKQNQPASNGSFRLNEEEEDDDEGHRFKAGKTPNPKLYPSRPSRQFKKISTTMPIEHTYHRKIPALDVPQTPNPQMYPRLNVPRR